jgi:hypothetical protein
MDHATRSGARALTEPFCHLDSYNLKKKCFTWKRTEREWRGTRHTSLRLETCGPICGVGVRRTSQSRVRRTADANAGTRRGGEKYEHSAETRKERQMTVSPLVRMSQVSVERDSPSHRAAPTNGGGRLWRQRAPRPDTSCRGATR